MRKSYNKLITNKHNIVCFSLHSQLIKSCLINSETWIHYTTTTLHLYAHVFMVFALNYQFKYTYVCNVQDIDAQVIH